MSSFRSMQTIQSREPDPLPTQPRTQLNMVVYIFLF